MKRRLRDWLIALGIGLVLSCELAEPARCDWCFPSICGSSRECATGCACIGGPGPGTCQPLALEAAP